MFFKNDLVKEIELKDQLSGKVWLVNKVKNGSSKEKYVVKAEAQDGEMNVDSSVVALFENENDALFTALAREKLPKALERIEELEREVEKLRNQSNQLTT